MTTALASQILNVIYPYMNPKVQEAIDTLILSPEKGIVRCRNCRYWQDNNGGYPHKDCKWCATETPDANDYCSAGEEMDT